MAKVNPEVHARLHDGGAKVHVVSGGRFEQENWTAWVNPEVELAVTFVETAPPVRTEPDWGLTPREKSKRAGDAGTERVTLNVVVRDIVPSEPATVTTCVPAGASVDVTRMSCAEQVGRHEVGANEQAVPGGRSTQENRMFLGEADAAVAVTVVVAVPPPGTGPRNGRTSKENSLPD
ncbi:MAG TPA: hypothetical protein VFA17_08690 [Thermoplasmata archaeon]|nr:hypothetical protein [Thermoplasmata archaeon]